jgi:hypothetical protein
MPAVYVSGPVMRAAPEWDLAPWVQEAYQALQGTLRAWGAEAQLPRAESGLERQPPREFFHAIKKRVTSAQAFVGVVGEGDMSTAVEAAMAAVAGKKLLLVVEDGAQVPRLLAGLPGMVGVIEASDLPAALDGRMAALLGPNAARKRVPDTPATPPRG